MVMVSSATILSTTLLGLIVVSTVFADVIHLKNLKENDKIYCEKLKTIAETTSASERANIDSSHLSVFNFNAKTDGQSAPTPITIDSSLSTTTSPLKSNSYEYSSNQAPLKYENPFSNTFSNDAAESFVGSILTSQTFDSSTPSPLYDGSFSVSSTPSTLIKSSTQTPSINDNIFPYTNFEHSLVSTLDSKSVLTESTPVISSTPLPVTLKGSPDVTTSYGISFSSNIPSFVHGSIDTKSDINHIVTTGNVPTSNQVIHINKEVAVPYYIQVEKIIPYPIEVRIPDPYPVTIEKHIPYAIKVNQDHPVHVPQLYPVEIEKKVLYPVEKNVPYEVKVPYYRPYPVHIPLENPVPYAVEKSVPYPVRVNVDRPYPVEKNIPYPVLVEKTVPYPVEKTVPYPVEKLVPYAVEKQVPYPVKYEVPVNVPVPVEVKVPVAVEKKVLYPVEKIVPFPVRVPVEVNSPVPVQAQRFAVAQYHQPSSISLNSVSAKFDQNISKVYLPNIASTTESQFYSTTSKPSKLYIPSPPSSNMLSSNTGLKTSYNTANNPTPFFDSNNAQDSVTEFNNIQKSSTYSSSGSFNYRQPSFIGA